MRFFLCAIFALMIMSPVFAQEAEYPGIIDTAGIHEEVPAMPSDVLAFTRDNHSILTSMHGNGFFDGRLSAMTNIRLSMFQFESQRYSNRNDRMNWENTGFDFSVFNIGPVDRNFFEDAHITVAYETERFGGRIAVDGGGLGGFMAWVQFTPNFRLSAGDIDAEFADALGADPGMRVYTGSTFGAWNSYVNPDNIRGDQGLMLEFFWGPLSIAGVATTNEITNMIYSRPTFWDGEVIMSRVWEYSGRIGWDLGEWGSTNISYNVRYESVASRFRTATIGGSLHPISADAEVFTHNIGAFASLTPTQDFAVTLGWAANITRYLDAFATAGQSIEHATTWPLVFKQGINLNARFTGIPNFTIRTDHNFSFWNDKDYTIFRLSGTQLNRNVLHYIIGGAYAEIERRILWNGFGVFYHIDENWNVGIYARNLRRSDTAGDIWLIMNETTIEPRLTWRLNENIEFFAAFNYTLLVERVSSAANTQRNPLPFVRNVRDTRDVNQKFSVPLGFTMSL
ncbi:MAG: hypothetical protein FWC97_00205 [Treponema sp.]|nr:hypothetical protein [Treponema sp.]